MTCDLLIGWRNKEPAWDLIGQDNHWEVPKRLRINTQNTLLEALLTSPRALECSVLLDLSLSLSPEKCTLLRMPSTDSLFSSGPHPASCYHDEKKSHLASLHPFIHLLLFIFFPLSPCAKLRLPAETSPKLCRASHEPTPTSTTPEL